MKLRRVVVRTVTDRPDRAPTYDRLLPPELAEEVCAYLDKPGLTRLPAGLLDQDDDTVTPATGRAETIVNPAHVVTVTLGPALDYPDPT